MGLLVFARHQFAPIIMDLSVRLMNSFCCSVVLLFRVSVVLLVNVAGGAICVTVLQYEVCSTVRVDGSSTCHIRK